MRWLPFLAILVACADEHAPAPAGDPSPATDLTARRCGRAELDWSASTTDAAGNETSDFLLGDEVWPTLIAGATLVLRPSTLTDSLEAFRHDAVGCCQQADQQIH